ncbi:FtsQ-type POTRA domain-containing protein [Clostridium sp. MCC353]|uniref:cell division protein FtsQ/DivIB n=1 Tax=Clostridium sp. MCC353 TaxID=2592646 RepID=UPI001C02C8B2|nr:FtsQ-type POTRA domain-containing protein [Clostridium sp. MCC353]MBT9779073.1 FtsQ-type POTRA domain-containing protein [Clostridium sp. MCC353]
MTDSSRNKGKTIIGIVLAVLLTAGILVLSVNIKTVTVSGNKQYTDEEIVELVLHDQWDWNTFFCYLRDKFQPHKQIPFVEDYKIVFQGLNQVEIIVYEKSVVGYVSYMSSYMYFDKDGIIVESTGTKLDGIPWITGLKFGHIVLHQPLPVENQKIFEEILNLTQVLTMYEIAVDKIQYDSHGQATLHIGEIAVVLGDNSEISGKIATLRDQLPVLEGKAGTLYLDTYDETKGDMWFSFIRK